VLASGAPAARVETLTPKRGSQPKRDVPSDQERGLLVDLAGAFGARLLHEQPTLAAGE
jgi:hypothetical protein